MTVSLTHSCFLFTTNDLGECYCKFYLSLFLHEFIFRKYFLISLFSTFFFLDFDDSEDEEELPVPAAENGECC